MEDLITWLRAQIEADRNAATVFHDVSIAAAHSDVGTTDEGAYDHYRMMIAPMQIIADTTAKLALLDTYQRVADMDDGTDVWAFSGAHGQANGLGEAVRTIAQGYCERDGWNPAWGNDKQTSG
ncbi:MULTISPECIES: DUF6221 family protein [unclassified Nocardiopsis]|uniref:DUF6221 family protein n=1 Tax=Nocardiopsis TaxID=2013 RepID=UPI00387B6A5C